jgi:6-phospho-3-hexuloisomerase
MTECKNLIQIIQELAENAKRIDNDQLTEAEKLIKEADRIFIAGAGRSGFAARGFANRLMHLGFKSFFVGEPTTPSIQKDDLLVIGSGSGRTESLVSMANKAKKQGAKLITLTIFPENTIGSLADVTIKIPGLTSKADNVVKEEVVSIQPKGNSFEQLSWLIYDSIIIDLKRETGQTEEQMFSRHANLE